MGRPAMVRVSFEVTREEAVVLLSENIRFVWIGGEVNVDSLTNTTERFWEALRRGLRRHVERTRLKEVRDE